MFCGVNGSYSPKAGKFSEASLYISFTTTQISISKDFLQLTVNDQTTVIPFKTRKYNLLSDEELKVDRFVVRIFLGCIENLGKIQASFFFFRWNRISKLSPISQSQTTRKPQSKVCSTLRMCSHCDIHRTFFNASIFAHLSKNDRHARLKISDFIKFVKKYVWLEKMRSNISSFDVSGNGYLVESELENFLASLIPSVQQVIHCCTHLILQIFSNKSPNNAT